MPERLEFTANEEIRITDYGDRIAVAVHQLRRLNPFNRLQPFRKTIPRHANPL